MVAWLDLVAAVAVVAAFAFLLRPRAGTRCGRRPPPPGGTEVRVTVAQLRATARRVARR
jgi:hypothetical protein